MCVVDAARWSRRREEAYKRFLEDVEIGYVDRDVIDLVKLAFSKKRIFTTSSCSGRITVVDAAYPWIRDESYVVFKKHEPVDPHEIETTISSRPVHRYWMVVSGPIIHFSLAYLEDTQKLLTVLRECGFKHSGVISITSSGIVVEAVSGVWTPFLLKDGDQIIVADLKHVVGVANSILAEGKSRLKKLYKAFKELEI